MESLAERAASGRRILAAGLVINAFLAFLKLGAGWLGNSAALIADGVESTLDVFSSAMIWGALKYAERPPDSDHPYGHGKMESLAAVGGALLLLTAGVFVAWNSLSELLHQSSDRAAPSAFTLFVLFGVVAIKETLFQTASRRGKEVGSTAVQSDAWHHRSDAITSLAAAIGISITLIGGRDWISADDWAALFSCGIIVFNGGRMLKSSLGEILDKQAPSDVIQTITAAALSVPGVENIEKCRVRKSGLSLIADLHVRVNGDVTVTAGHAISHRVKDTLLSGGHQISDVTVHIEPA
jgi:cation diffusion facilitator family transporter